MTLKETLLTAWNLLNPKIDFFDFERNEYNIDYTKDIFHVYLNKNQINLSLYDEYILKITSLKKIKYSFDTILSNIDKIVVYMSIIFDEYLNFYLKNDPFPCLMNFISSVFKREIKINNKSKFVKGYDNCIEFYHPHDSLFANISCFYLYKNKDIISLKENLSSSDNESKLIAESKDWKNIYVLLATLLLKDQLNYYL